jgi:hypothetical protein
VACEYLGVFLGFGLAAPHLREIGEVSWGKPLAVSILSCALMGVGLAYFPRLYWLVLGPVVYGISLYFLGGLDPEDRENLKSIFSRKT